MNADSAFQIGASHAICQDYAIASDRPPVAPSAEPCLQTGPYVILSDGCSSSPDTDVGARLLVRAAQQTLLEFGEGSKAGPPEMHEAAARRALAWAKALGLSPEAVDATLLTLHLDDGKLVAACTGDGVVCFQSVTGALDVYSITYTSGYPLYPGYALQPERLLALKGRGGYGKEVRHLHSPSVDEPLQPRGTSNSRSFTEVFTVEAHDYRYATIFSDGIHSFYSARQTETSRRAEAAPLDMVLRGLVSFKSTRGAFVSRRMKSFLKDCHARGWRHVDDLSAGSLHLGG